jgi:hypothetical protein
VSRLVKSDKGSYHFLDLVDCVEVGREAFRGRDRCGGASVSVGGSCFVGSAWEVGVLVGQCLHVDVSVADSSSCDNRI